MKKLKTLSLKVSLTPNTICSKLQRAALTWICDFTLKNMNIGDKVSKTAGNYFS